MVADPGIAGLPMVARMVEACRTAGLAVAVHSDVRPNPVEANVTSGVAAFRTGGHDGVVAVGGGSALDVGKVVAFMAGQPRPSGAIGDTGTRGIGADAGAIAHGGREPPH